MDKKSSELDGTIIGEDRAELQAPEGVPAPPNGDSAETGRPGTDSIASPTGLIILRPAVRSMWFLFFGLLLGPAIMYFGRDPDGHPAKWVALSLVSLSLILHRLGLRYLIEGGQLRARSWWGLGPEESVSLAAVTEVRPREGFVGRLVGCSHLDVRSGVPDEPGLIIMGQPDGWRLARRLEELAAEARRSAAREPADQRSAPDDAGQAPPEANLGSG